MPSEREIPFSDPHIDWRALQIQQREPNVRTTVTPQFDRLWNTHKPESFMEALMQTDPSAVPDLSYQMRPIIEAVAECIDQLDEEQRFVIEATFYERASLQEVGDRLGVSKTHAWRLRNSATARLGELLKEHTLIRSKYMEPETWGESAAGWVASLSTGQTLANPLDIESSVRLRDMMIRNYDKSGEITLMSAFKGIAYDAIGELRYSGHWSTQRMTDLLISKQRDYGHGNINAFGTYGVLVRLSDKIERLKNLMSNGIKPTNESVIDTLQDMVGYCVIAMMLDDGTFALPLGETDE